MRRFSKTLPPNRDLYTLGDLIYWHVVVYGTRPDGHPSAPFGQPWDLALLAPLIDVDARTLRNWMRDKHLPQEFDALLVELFGSNAAFAAWRQELVDAYNRVTAKQPNKRGIWRRAQALVRVGEALENIGKDNGSNRLGTGLRALFGSGSVRGITGAGLGELDGDDAQASGKPRGPSGSSAAPDLREPIDVEFEDISPCVKPGPVEVPLSEVPPSAFARRILVPALLASVTVLFVASMHHELEELLRDIPWPSFSRPERLIAPGTMSGTRPVREFKFASGTEFGPRHPRETPTDISRDDPPPPVPIPPPIPREAPPPSQPMVDTPWRAEQVAEALRLASRTQEQADNEKRAAWDRQVQAMVNDGFTIHPSETLTGEKLDRAPARTAEDCARSCAASSCTGWVFEDQRGLCDRYTGNVKLKPYGLGYTAGVRASRASSADVLVPAGTSSSLPIEKVQAPIASISGPDGIARCANGSFKAPGFDLVCDRNLYGGGMLGRYPQRSPAGSFNECADLCRSIDRCVVFTWEENGRPPRTCHIFGPGGFQSNAAGGQISGFRCGGITDKRQLQATGHISCPAQ